MVGLQSLNYVLALTILAPGFILYETVRWRGKITKPVATLDKAIYTLVGSGFSIAIIVILAAIINPHVDTKLLDKNIILEELIILIILSFIICLTLGYTLGYRIDDHLYNGDDLRKETVWQLIHNHREIPTEVYVVTVEGTEVHGYIWVSDSEPHGQDLLLRYPSMVIRDQSGKEKSREGIGNSIFISETDISHVYFDSDIDI